MKSKKKNLSILSISLTSGGAEKVISLLLKKLRCDYNVTLVLLYNIIHFPIPENINLKILIGNDSNRSVIIKFFDFFAGSIRYLRFVKSSDIAVSLSFLALPNFMNCFVAVFRSNKKTKTIISERGFPSDNTTTKLSHYISKIFYPLLYNRCDKLFSNSVYINKDLRDNFGIIIPMDVIYNPIEFPTHRINPKDFKEVKHPFKVITAGTLNNRKNQIMIIKAVIKNKFNYKLSILGAGPLEQILRKKIIENNLERTVYLEGRVTSVNKYFLKNDCFVLSSFTEGFPNALLEAMAIGLPCISTNCLSGPLEMLNENININIKLGEFYKGKYGILINNDDHEGLYKALEFLRNNKESREYYSKQSIERSKEYHLSIIYSKFYKYINK